MKKGIVLLVVLGLVGTALRADKERIAIVTASELGTYAEMAVNLKEVCTHLDFELFTSSGSADNVAQMLDNSQGIHFGIAQVDVLYLLNNFDDDNKLKMNKVKMVFPLYDEEIHIVARKDSPVSKFKDLGGKKVNVGLKDSGTEMTAILLQKLTGVQFSENNLAPEAALEALVNGQIDAMIYVIGQPAPLFLEEEKEEKEEAVAATTETGKTTGVTGEESATSTPKTGIDSVTGDETAENSEPVIEEKKPTLLEQVKLVPLRNKKLNKLYTQTTIPAGSYEWQSTPVDTYKITSVLITSVLTPERKVRKLTRCALDNLPKLRKDYHEKWREINPKNYGDLNWPMSEAAEKEIKK